MSMPVGLYDCLTTNFVGGQVSIPKAVGVDAYQVPEIHDLSIGLRCMTDNDAFAALVGSREWGRQVSPVRHYLRLFKHRNVRIVRCVYKDGVVDFMVWKQLMEKGKMIRWNPRQ